MSAFNIVRFRVKAGSEQAFIDAHRKMRPDFKGFIAGHLVRTGDQTFCIIGEWRDFSSLAAARPEMIGLLDSFRHLLDDLGGGLGLTDPVSGESVARLQMAKPVAKAAPTKIKAKAKTKAKAKKTTKKKKKAGTKKTKKKSKKKK